MEPHAQQAEKGPDDDGAHPNTREYPFLTSIPAGPVPRGAALYTPTTGLHPAESASRDRRFRPYQSLDRHQSAIRLRRLRPPTRPTAATLSTIPGLEDGQSERHQSQRRRSSSEPHRPTLPRVIADAGSGRTTLPVLSVIEAPSNGSQAVPTDFTPTPVPLSQQLPASRDSYLSRRRQTVQGYPLDKISDEDCYDSRIVDFLDVVG